MNYLDSLIVWAYEKGYHVDFTPNGDDCICNISKIIEINSSASTKKQIIRLLHECGHVLIFSNGSKFNFIDKEKYKENTDGYKIYTIIEEIEAWKRGRELANRLKIPIDDVEWEKSMVSALKKYVKWANSDKNNEEYIENTNSTS